MTRSIAHAESMQTTGTARYAPDVSKAVQIRDVPDEVVTTLKSRAAADGRSLSDYLRLQLIDLASRPTPAELEARIKAREPVDPDQLDEPIWKTIRRMRDAADA